MWCSTVLLIAGSRPACGLIWPCGLVRLGSGTGVLNVVATAGTCGMMIVIGLQLLASLTLLPQFVVLLHAPKILYTPETFFEMVDLGSQVMNTGGVSLHHLQQLFHVFVGPIRGQPIISERKWSMHQRT